MSKHVQKQTQTIVDFPTRLRMLYTSLGRTVAQPEWGRRGHGPPKQTC